MATVMMTLEEVSRLEAGDVDAFCGMAGCSTRELMMPVNSRTAQQRGRGSVSVYRGFKGKVPA